MEPETKPWPEYVDRFAEVRQKHPASTAMLTDAQLEIMLHSLHQVSTEALARTLRERGYAVELKL